jgi:hypothetical protein
MDHKELKEAIFDMFRKSKEAPKPQYKRIDSMLGGKMNLTANDFAQLDPNSDPYKLKAAFETAYLRGNTDSRASLKTLLDTAPYNEMKDMVDLIDNAKGTANTNPNRQFGASNQPTVRRSGGGLFEEQHIYKQNTMTQEQLRMQMLAGIITEGEYKAKLNEDEYNDSQAEARLAELANKVFQEVSNYKDLTPELIEEEPGYYRIKFTKPGKLFRKEKTGELHLFIDQNPDTLIMKVIFNGELEQKDTLNWGEGMFADDDAIYEKVAREADKVAMHLMEK